MVRFTYVTGSRQHPHIESPAVEVPLWSLSALREGIDYIVGVHEDWSEEAKALLAAYKLAESAG